MAEEVGIGQGPPMTQLQLPVFPEGITPLSRDLGVGCQDGYVSYFYGTLPVFRHRVQDVRSFRMFTSQLYLEGKVKQSRLVRVFGVSPISVKRSVKLYEQGGPGGFWQPRPTRGPAVLTPAVLQQAQAQLDQRHTLRAVAAQLHVKYDTLQKAVRARRLQVPLPIQAETVGDPVASAPELSNKSERSVADAQAPLGVATQDVTGRVLASLGQAGPVASCFEPCADVPKAGVLVALPALLASGLWEHTEEHFQLPAGYYALVHLFLLVAFLALARIKSLESLRYCAPGEWGKVLGLDRIPEVRTLREKLDLLGQEVKVAAWSAQLSRQWMAEDPESAGTLYVDGHVRVYHGSAARLPKHYVPRQRLCLRATTDYWVNALDGQPFFVVHRPVDPGLLKVLEEEILPRLEREVPHQPTAEQLAADPTLDKFIVVYDREGYSPAGLQRMKQRRIGCLTYHKHPGPDWPVSEFKPVPVKLAHGNEEELQLAERALVLSNGLAVREIRQREETGHQTALLATTQRLSIGAAAAGLFRRWSQENFLKYMREHYALDRLLSYQVEKMDETTVVVNPAWRKLDRAVRSLTAKLHPKLARFGALNLTAAIEPEAVESFLKKKAAVQQEIQHLQTQLRERKAERAAAAHHLPIGQVPEAERFDRLSSGSKDLVDTIKLVAYRAETAMAQVVRAALPQWRQEEERRLLQSLYTSEADLIPDAVAGTLTVRLHYPANAMLARAIQTLCAELTATETVFPTTQLRLVYQLADGVPSAERRVEAGDLPGGNGEV
jgi:hypothetical protein